MGSALRMATYALFVLRGRSAFGAWYYAALWLSHIFL